MYGPARVVLLLLVVTAVANPTFVLPQQTGAISLDFLARDAFGLQRRAVDTALCPAQYAQPGSIRFFQDFKTLDSPDGLGVLDFLYLGRHFVPTKLPIM
ncbi:hypothetical protein IFR05_007541 [Cadophora sp. M221]|nr:hypothetical protein IFR05_007541 [Cadophora sp. M221]